MKPVIIFGTGKLAELVYYYLKFDSEYSVAGFAVDSKFIDKTTFFDLPIIAFEDIEKKFPASDYSMFIAISHAQLNEVRTKKYFEAKQKGYELISYISSKSTIWNNTTVGENCLIMENCAIQPYTKIGNNVIVCSSCNIGHHSIIKNNSFFASGAVLAGGVIVKDNCFIGLSATIGEDVIIEKNCIIGANSLILKDTKANNCYVCKTTNSNEIKSDKLKYMLQPTRKWS